MATDDIEELRSEIARLHGETTVLAIALGTALQVIAAKTGARVPFDEALADIEAGDTAPRMREGGARVLRLIMDMSASPQPTS